MKIINASAALPADRMIAHARRHSRFLDRLLESRPDSLEGAALGAPLRETDMREMLESRAPSTDAELKHALRRLRQTAMARLVCRDLGGAATLDEVMNTATGLATVTIAHAVRWLAGDLAGVHGAPRGPDGRVQQLHVIGMGKLGGCELNVSSDIDLVFAYPEEGETDGARPLSNHEFFTRLARRLIPALSEITEDGFVFRVDMRLRPYGDGSPLVSSFDMLENYFITQGREWERYAWIKARALTGDRAQELADTIRPFVYRRHLDFSALASMRDMHQQIRREVGRRDMADNIKLGPGGIREIEFIAQVFQLIRGGHDAALRVQPTLEVLARLVERRLLPAEPAQELASAYAFLRNLEHRLQYLDDRQTQALPATDTDRALVAQSMGCANWPEFGSALAAHRERVSGQFNQIFAASPAQQHALAELWQDGGDPEHGSARLAGLGFRRAVEIRERLSDMRSGSRYRQMPATNQQRLDRLVPVVIEAAAACPNADDTLTRMLDLLEAVSRRESYLALLEEYPQARSRLADLASASPWVAQYLAQHPILLDELLDARSLYETPDWSVLATTLARGLDESGNDVETQMNALRHFKHAQTLRLVAQDLAGIVALETLSDHLSDLACVILTQVLRLAWNGLRQRHRDVPAFAVVAYGKLGGKELGYASDLDLVFLHDDPEPGAPETYARLAQRINHWLTAMTPAGVLYETDLRLRPDGAGGMLVSTIGSFREYQTAQAWPWEHQALTRARFVCGDADIGRQFEECRAAVLRAPRDAVALREAILDMRAKMLTSHPNPGPLFDVKHDRGGLIDVEFIVQFLVLGHAREHAELTGNIGNLALLKLAARIGLIPDAPAAAAHDAYRRFRQLQHALRLRGDRYARVEARAHADDAAAVMALWQTVFGT